MQSLTHIRRKVEQIARAPRCGSHVLYSEFVTVLGGDVLPVHTKSVAHVRLHPPVPGQTVLPGITLWVVRTAPYTGCRRVVESTEDRMVIRVPCLFRESPPPVVYVRDPATDTWSRVED